MNYTEDCIVPIISILKNHTGDVRLLLSNAKSLRVILVEMYERNISELDLKQLPIEEKRSLWEASKICSEREEWCKAVRFIEAV